MLWTVIDGSVYDITNYVNQHPGGLKKIMRGVEKDSTEMFHKFHHGINIDGTPLAMLKIGEVYPPPPKSKKAQKSKGGLPVEDDELSKLVNRLGIGIDKIESSDEEEEEKKEEIKVQPKNNFLSISMGIL